MRRVLTFLLFIGSIHAFSQYSSLEVDLIGPIGLLSNNSGGWAWVSYEKTFHSHISYSVGLKYSNEKLLKKEAGRSESSDYSAFGSLKVYPFGSKKVAPLGFSIESSLYFGSLNQKVFLAENSFNSYSGIWAGYGLNLGYKSRLSKQLFLEFILGYGKALKYDYNNNEERKQLNNNDTVKDSYKYLLPLKFNISLGYLFNEVDENPWTKEHGKRLKKQLLIGIPITILIAILSSANGQQ